MKKMIPVYLIQLGILAAVLVIGTKMLNVMRATQSEVNALSVMTTQTGARERRDAPAIKVKVVGGVYVDNMP